MRFLKRTSAFLCSIALSMSAAADPQMGGAAYYTSRVRPLLEKHCFECHSGRSGKQKGDLRLDFPEGWHRGGASGPAVIPHRAEESLLVQAVRYSRSDLQMPPDGKLSEGDVEILETWIRIGAPAPHPGEPPLSPESAGAASLPSLTRHWAFQPISETALPPIAGESDPPYRPIDLFLAEALRSRGLAFAAEASGATWLRRVAFTLAGLPLSREDMERFLEAGHPNARERLVDRFLASPRFGERWGRHWLDVARFGESSGGGRSLMFPNAWRYRDYVIDAFNQDLPFDAFVREQIAGDLMPTADPGLRKRRLIAAGFLVLGPTNYEQQDKEKLAMDVVDEQIDTVGRAFLGLTLGCARCHDHKFDPVSTGDYYGLAGIFKSTKSMTPGNVSRFYEAYLESPDAWQEHQRKIDVLAKKLNAARKSPMPSDADGGIQDLEERLAALKATMPLEPAKAMTVTDESEPADARIHLRGEIRRLGKVAPRGFLAAVTPAGEDYRPVIPPSQSGRLQLANWLASPRHPLVARVYVNRLWSKIFHVGLVRTVDNFGTTGEAPSHPELLDYLAKSLADNGWSTKYLVREMVLSRAFASAVVSCDEGERKDPRNRFLWSMRRHRLEAECLRDAMLAAGGTLDLRQEGRTIRKLAEYDHGYVFNSDRRSVYVPAFRNTAPEILEVFNRANPNVVEGRRTHTNLATQSLYLLNSPFVHEQARLTAGRFFAEDDPIGAVYGEILSRPPTAAERAATERFLDLSLATPGDSQDHLDRLALVVQSLFASLDFRYLH